MVILDILLRNGQCIDPETGLDRICNVGIREGRIEYVVDPTSGAAAECQTSAHHEIDCTGLTITPGFIDLHSHGAGYVPSAKLQALDGCTFHGEFEFGVCDVEKWYADRLGSQIIHYAASAGHIPNRIAVLSSRIADSPPVFETSGNDILHPAETSGKDILHQQVKRRRRHLREKEYSRHELAAPHKSHSKDPHLLSTCFCTAHKTHHLPTTSAEVELITTQLENGLKNGACGLGLGIAYTSAADHEEIYRIFKLGARWKVPLFIHSRGTMEDLTDFHEMFANSAASGAPLHICHLNSSAAPLNMPLILEMISDLNKRGVDVTTEAYPYTAGMTRLDSGVFEPGWQDRLKISPEDIEWIETGERLTEDTFATRRQQGGLVAVHSISEQIVQLCLTDPRVMIASDAIPYTPDGKGHPRSAGCFCRVLGVYVRERAVLSLIEAIKKMTLLPAKRLEASCPAFKKKGRLQQGMDADICIFNAATVTDNATFANPMLPSSGVRELIVDGKLVVHNGVLQEGSTPGRGYRAEW